MADQQRLDRRAVHQTVRGVERVQADEHLERPGEVRCSRAVEVVAHVQCPSRRQAALCRFGNLWRHLVHGRQSGTVSARERAVRTGILAVVQIAMLGPLEVRRADGDVEIAGARLRSLLTLLALEAPKPVAASALVDAVWGERPPADEANALQSLVSRLRRALGDADLIQQSPAGYRLALEATDVDVHEFERLSRGGRDALRAGNPDSARAILTEALALWRGDALEATDGGQIHGLLARLDEQRLDARADLIEAQLELGAATDVVSELESLVAAHPLRERFVALLVEALSAAGRQADALNAYECARARLADELGIDPSTELQAIHLRVLRGDSIRTRARAASPHNLRASLTSFVGRDKQVDQIGALLTNGRLVTLVGPGGAGKTRLAGEAAATLVDSAADGVWLAELAPVTDPADVPQTVLGSLGLREAVLLERPGLMTPRDAVSRLIDALSEQSVILLLDNCEHLIDAAAQLADQLLARCPRLRILATSREPLGIIGESLVVVPPLSQPEPTATAAEALACPAVRLFADRAVAVQPGFEVDDSTAAAVIEIVRRLDGLPLAIELAAARLRSLPVAEVASRLSDRFRLLTGGSRTAMPRHRTLSGGVTPRAAAAVCGLDDLDDLLASLVDKSLLHVATSSGIEPRYRMLETIREFGLERMAERNEVGQLRAAHAAYYAALVAEADPHLRSAEQLEWMATLAIERDNILAALKYFSDEENAAAALALVNLLGWYWMTLGNHGEIVTWVSYALDIAGNPDPGQRLMAEAFLAINTLAWEVKGSHDEVAAGMTYLADVSSRMEALGEDAPPMLSLLTPIIAIFVGDDERGARLIEAALNNDDPWMVAAVRTFRASIAENVGDAEGMRKDAELSLAAFRALGERWGMANSLQVLGQLELMEGNLDAAAAAYLEALELAEVIGAREDLAFMRLRLADIVARQGDPVGAAEHARLAHQATQRSGSSIESIFTEIIRVEIARVAGDLEAARRMRDESLQRLGRLPQVHPILGHGMAVMLATAAKIDVADGDLPAAKARLVEAYHYALETKDMPIVAGVAVAVAMLAERSGDPAGAAAILGAAAQLRGAADLTNLDIAALNASLDDLPGGKYAVDYLSGSGLSRAAAIAAVNPAELCDPAPAR
jgi:predicted ATPase/DNA-binding SARP family transcriptional activator